MISSTRPVPTVVTFDGWSLDRTTGELSKDGVTQRLQEQPLQILDELLAIPGALVTRERLIDRLWPHGVVDFDTSLNTAVRKLRLALRDDANHPRYIGTLPRKGYRFIGRVDVLEGSVPPVGVVELPLERSRLSKGFGAYPRAAALLLVCALLAGAWTFVHAPDAGSPDRGGPGAIVAELYATAKARADIPATAGRAPRERVLELLARLLAIDPAFAPAYVIRARTKLGLFLSNLDVGDANLEEIRNDLDKARHLAGDELIGLDVRAGYLAAVDLDPEAALRLTEVAPDDADVLKARAGILMTLGRFRESNQIFDRFLALDPGHLRSLRGKTTNLIAEGRSGEALESLGRLQEVAPPGGNPWADWPIAPAGVATPSLEETRDRIQALDADGENFFEVWGHLTQLERDGRHSEVRKLLAGLRPESVRLAAFTGPMPGIGRMPVASLRGWNHLLLQDAAAAAASGRQVQAFVAAQRMTKWNAWYLRMLEAEAQVFLGDKAAAAAAARDALEFSLTNRYAELYRDYLAAAVFAWAAEEPLAIARIESVASRAPGHAPTMIGRNQRLSVPLEASARFGELRAKLLFAAGTER
jgi:DNA-binding winged helix-turn-helix (wHTH) protein/tetratricopeptide (TPR) repeat protein